MVYIRYIMRWYTHLKLLHFSQMEKICKGNEERK